MKKTIQGLMVTALLIMSTSGANAKETIGVGVQTGLLSTGLSVKVDLTDKYTVQGVLGLAGDYTEYSLKGIYNFQNKKNYSLYGYGRSGIWKWDSGLLGDESVVGYGAGAGVEYDLRGLSPDFIPLFVNFEIGMDIITFDDLTAGGFSSGLGLHYKF